MHRQLAEIINSGKITTVFQPIFNVEREKIVGYEALTRGPEGSELYSPELLFNLATEYGYLSQLEILCRNSAIKRFAELELEGKLFLNVSPMILLNPDHPQGETIRMVENCGLKGEQIVIEISEKYPIPSSDLLYKALEKYRQFGFEVAIDDLGAGYAGLKQWSYLRPDIVKIDRYFIAGCHQDVIKREFLRTIFELGRATNSKVIAEGIESEEEFELLAELGMTHAQGFLLAKPEKIPRNNYPQISLPNIVQDTTHSLGTVKSVIANSQTVSVDHSADAIYQVFARQPRLQCLPVLNNNKAVGIIYREQLMEFFSDIYGRALFAKKKAVEIMDGSPLIIDQNTRLEDASIYITQLSDDQFSRYFIVESQGYYLGLGSLRELLRRITEAKIENARYANPLTMLPGNVPIDREIDYLLNQNTQFHLAYLDLNNFKPFNDIYGYAKGDLMLKQLASIITNCTNNKDCFVGHIGGDDFVIVFKSDNFKACCEQILMDFEQQSLQFFDDKHVEANGYYAANRSGEKTFYPLVSLAIGVVSPDVTRCFSHNEVSSLAADAKSQAKKADGNTLFICRRKAINAAENWQNHRHSVA